VLPIGGLNEKLLAARRNGYKTVLIPSDNTADVAEIRENITKDLVIVPVESVEEALDWVFPNWEKIVAERVEKNAAFIQDIKEKKSAPAESLN